MIGINTKCWLIGNSSAEALISARQFARFRGIEILSSRRADGLPSKTEATSLIAATFATLSELSLSERERLRSLISGGATLYLRGEVEPSCRFNLSPIVESSFSIGGAIKVASYRFTKHELTPAVLRDEHAKAELSINAAVDIRGPAEPLLIARHEDGTESPVVFAYRCGRGTIVCDVQAQPSEVDSPLIWRLADPIQRCENISALIAVDHACGRDASAPISFNLTIDDIPLGYDFFNEAILEDFMEHIEKRCAGVHLDCAWIPSSQRLSRRYVEILKSHGAGFVWHGMARHLDHQKIKDPVAELREGNRAMEAIRHRYNVYLQPIVIFPFERASDRCEELLLQQGFIAGAEQPRHDEGLDAGAEYCRFGSASCVHDSGLPFLHRYEAKFLTHERMLAIAMLGMPILVFGHPKDVRLRRLSGLIDRGGSFAHFDHVLDFASSKGLPARSLEQIARESLNQPAYRPLELQCA